MRDRRCNGVGGVTCRCGPALRPDADRHDGRSRARLLEAGTHRDCHSRGKAPDQIRVPRLYGSDYDTSQIEWCRSNLPFAEFTANGLAPPLPFEDDSFDFAYALSVFTHLDEGLQIAWTAEFKRVIKPGGYLLLTLLGPSHLDSLDALQRERFLAGELVVSDPEGSGTNACTAYHPEPYVREKLAEGFSVVTISLSGSPNEGQDAVLLRSQP
jgi:SAM-dependent methyltransferase